jgi:uncharacterized protein (TIRG00374 family)
MRRQAKRSLTSSRDGREAEMRRSIPIIASVIIIAVMVALVMTRGDLFRALGNISGSQVVLLLALAFGGLIAQAQQFRAALTVSDTDVGMFEATGLTAVNTMANYYVPARGGTVVRGAYMNAVHAMSVSAYVLLAVATVIAGLIVATACGLAAGLLLSISGSDVGAGVLVPFVGALGVVAGALAIAVLSAKWLRRSKRLSMVIEQAVAAAAMWRDRPAAAVKLLAWTTVVLAFQAARLFVAFRAVGASVDVLEMILIGSLVSIGFVISITPGNLGIKEGVTVLAGVLVGVEPDTALLASLIDRAAALVVTFGVGVASVGPLVSKAAASGGVEE